MPALTGPGLVAAALLALAGAQKLLDPEMTVGALRALRLPSSPLLVRLGSAAELALGVAAIAVGGAALWWLVALSYVAFAGFVVAALRQGTMIGTCGCFGREETPPHWSHVALNLAFAGVAAVLAIGWPAAPAEALVESPPEAIVLVALAGIAVMLARGAYVELPRTLSAGSSLRSRAARR